MGVHQTTARGDQRSENERASEREKSAVEKEIKPERGAERAKLETPPRVGAKNDQKMGAKTMKDKDMDKRCASAHESVARRAGASGGTLLLGV